MSWPLYMCSLPVSFPSWERGLKLFCLGTAGRRGNCRSPRGDMDWHDEGVSVCWDKRGFTKEQIEAYTDKDKSCGSIIKGKNHCMHNGELMKGGPNELDYGL